MNEIRLPPAAGAASNDDEPAQPGADPIARAMELSARMVPPADVGAAMVTLGGAYNALLGQSAVLVVALYALAQQRGGSIALDRDALEPGGSILARFSADGQRLEIRAVPLGTAGKA